MRIESSVSSPWIPPQAIGGSALPAPAPTTIPRQTRAGSFARAAKVVAACLIEALVILSFVAASLGIGAEDHWGIGPDRPPPPTTPAPEPPPDQRPESMLTMVANEGSSLTAGRRP